MAKHQNYTVIRALGSNPNPATYCPANGYELIDTGSYTPPINVGTPSTEEIILLCDNYNPSVICLKATTSSGKYTTKVYDSSNNLISSVDTNSGTAYTYYFPTAVMGSLYVIKITPTTGGSSLLTFTLNNTITGFTTDWNVLQAKFNTPNITSLASAFYKMSKFKSIEFNCTLNYLTSLANAFYQTEVGYIDFTVAMPLLTTMSYMLFSCKNLKTFKVSLASLPALTDMSYAVGECPLLKEVDLSTVTLDSLSNLSGLVMNDYSLKTLKLPSSLPALTSIINLANGCVSLNEMGFPTSFSNLTTMTSCLEKVPMFTQNLTIPEFSGAGNYQRYMFRYTGFKKIVMTGTCSSSEISEPINGNNYIEEFETPRSMPNCTVITNLLAGAPRLSKVRLPDTLGAVTTTMSSINWSAGITEVTGNFDNSAAASFTALSLTVHKLKVFNCPQMRLSGLTIGSTTNKVAATSIEVYWESAALVSITLYADLSSTELNRIMGRLLTVASGTLKISGCTGYAGCTPSIATSKGWTVS